MIERVGQWCYRRRWITLAIWIFALIAMTVFGNVFKGEFSNSFELPGTESQRAFRLLAERFPQRAGDDATLAFRAPGGVAAKQSQITSIEDRFAAREHVLDVAGPFDQGGERQISRDGTIAYATVQFDKRADELDREDLLGFIDFAKTLDGQDGLAVTLGGRSITFVEQEPPEAGETVGFLAAVVILLVAFGSVLAMGLPILTAIMGIGISLAALALFQNFITVPEFTPQIMNMIGIGVGIDYALFVVTRYRTGLKDGLDPEEAVVRAVGTAGRAVVFAGITVVISLLGILLMGFAFVQGIAVGSATAVLITMIAAVTLLPAMLGFCGRKIDRLSLHTLTRLMRRKVFRMAPAREHNRWLTMSRAIQRRPAVFAAAALLIMLTLSAPLLALRLGLADEGSSEPGLGTRKTYDLLTRGFGAGFNGPLLLVVETPAGAATELPGLMKALQGTDNVAFVGQPQANQVRDTSIITVVPKTAPQDERTDDLVRNLREDVIPNAVKGTPVKVSIGGLTAAGIDFGQKIADRLPLLITVVLALSFLLLMAVFRSILVPLKAVIMNLLSIGAAYGVIVAVFQWGWLGDLIGIGRPGPIEAWAPMMLFAILFGLSMDYEVFLLSRIREEYVRTRNNADAVAVGLASTARVITAAAAIMISIFLSFVFIIPGRQIKLFGLGMAVAIFVDATIVRMVLVPATMELLGDANWYLPKWLGRILPKISIEGTHAAAEAELGAPVPGLDDDYEDGEVIDFAMTAAPARTLVPAALPQRPAPLHQRPAAPASTPDVKAPEADLVAAWHDRLTSVGVTEFKSRAPDVFREAESGKTVLVTRNGKPVAVVVPFEKMDKARRAADKRLS